MLSRSCCCAQAGHQMSLCWAHGLLFVGAMCSHVDCLSPPILLLNHCFSGSRLCPPSLPSFVSLYSSPCVCSPVLIRVFRVSNVVWVFHVWLCPSLLPACLFFPLRGVFVFFVLFYIKNNFFPCIWVLDLISRDRTDQPRWGLSRGGVWDHPPPATISSPPIPTQSSSLRPWAPAVSRAMTWGGCRGVQWCSWGARLQWWGPSRTSSTAPLTSPQRVEDEGAGPPHIWGICEGLARSPAKVAGVPQVVGRQGWDPEARYVSWRIPHEVCTGSPACLQ